MKWKTVKLPEQVYQALKEEAERQGVAVWKVIVNLVAGVRAKKGRKPLSESDKIIWYVYKFASSVGEYRGNPTEENYKRLEETCKQLHGRLKIDTSDFLSVARKYDGSNQARKVLNDVAKDVVARILSTYQ
jgi:hypothetical protein